MNGLAQLVIEGMERRPNDGSIYVFQNRAKNKVKILMWDSNGFVLGYKRLERGRFDFPVIGGTVQITGSQFWQLISGMPMVYLGQGAEKKTVFS
jgi:transposase